MKVESKIRVGQLVRIDSQRVINPNGLYLVVAKHGPNCELIPVNKKTNGESRRWWTEQGLSVYA
tara:strand:+ start:297 stop:488 length:192 start_codon:yes stop_codon:yes gene_type:complete